MSSYNMEIRSFVGAITDDPNDMIPHTFILVQGPDKEIKGYGFAPLEPGKLESNGFIYDDTRHLSTNSSGKIELSEAQYNNLMSYIEKTSATPPPYDLPFGSQCATWAVSAYLAAFGENRPDLMSPSGILKDITETVRINPYTLSLYFLLQNSVKAIQNGGKNINELSGNYDPLGNFIGDLQTRFQTALTTVSPLILDLDRDGVETLSASLAIHFDHDGNRFAETTGWVAPDDGLLVWDRNGNGLIDGGSELFGNYASAADGSSAANGFLALAALDDNHNGTIDAADAAFSQLRVWKDADSNAVASNTELLTLEAAGVQGLGLAYVSQSVTDAQGNQLLQAGSYVDADGAPHALVDAWFGVDTARTVDLTDTPIDDAIVALPDLPGFGNVPTLHQAMARDGSGRLQALVTQFAQEGDSLARNALVQDILFTWTGSDRYSAASRGTYIDDARKLYALEAFLGQHFIQGAGANEGTDMPAQNAAAILGDAYQELEDRFYGLLLAQTHFRNLLDQTTLAWDANASRFRFDTSALQNALIQADENNPQTGAQFVRECAICLLSFGDPGQKLLADLAATRFADHPEIDFLLMARNRKKLFGSAADDVLALDDDPSHALFAGAGNDTLSGGSKSDMLYGGPGDDVITGAAGDDIIAGGAGNDLIIGRRSDGADTIRFGKGDGSDTIVGNSNYGDDLHDTIDLYNVDPNSVDFMHEGEDLRVRIRNAADQVLIKDFFSSDGYSTIATFRFADGVTLERKDVLERAVTFGTDGDDLLRGHADDGDRIFGLAGNDAITGSAFADIIDGGDGNDIINGGNSNDVITGGRGDDLILGARWDGIDTIRYARGDGADTIDSTSDYYDDLSDRLQFADIASSDVDFACIDADLRIRVHDSTDQIVLKDFFAGSPHSTVTRFEFADGVILDRRQVLNQAIARGTEGNDRLRGNDYGASRIDGLGGDDVITGSSHADVIEGGEGNDRIQGGSGDDVISGGHGDDLISGNPSDGADTVCFARGDGADTIDSTSGWSGDMVDTLDIADYAPRDLRFVRVGNDLQLQAQTTNDCITLTGFFAPDWRSTVAHFRFADGSLLERDAVSQLAATYGTDDDDTIMGGYYDSNTLRGLGGRDTLYGGMYADLIDGGEGNDRIYSRDGNDTLTGGAGNDALYGDAGNDTYRYAQGDGADTITDDDPTPGNTDTLTLAAGITRDQLWLIRDGYDLDIRLLDGNANDRVTVANWYADAGYHIEQIRLADGATLFDNQINALVDAMAAFAPPPAGSSALPGDYQAALAPVIAASWK